MCVCVWGGGGVFKTLVSYFFFFYKVVLSFLIFTGASTLLSITMIGISSGATNGAAKKESCRLGHHYRSDPIRSLSVR